MRNGSKRTWTACAAEKGVASIELNHERIPLGILCKQRCSRFLRCCSMVVVFPAFGVVVPTHCVVVYSKLFWWQTSGRFLSTNCTPRGF